MRNCYKCPKCGQLLSPSNFIHYDFHCPLCYENFYDFQAVECTQKEVSEDNFYKYLTMRENEGFTELANFRFNEKSKIFSVVSFSYKGEHYRSLTETNGLLAPYPAINDAEFFDFEGFTANRLKDCGDAIFRGGNLILVEEI